MLAVTRVTFEGAASAFLGRAPAVSAACGSRFHTGWPHSSGWGECGAGRRRAVVALQNCEQTGWTSVAVLGFAAAAQPAPPPEIALGTRGMRLLTGDAEAAEEPTRMWRERS